MAPSGASGASRRRSSIPLGVQTFFKNVTIAGGPAPARAYIEELLPTSSKDAIEPAGLRPRGGLDEVPDGYRAMNEREALKVRSISERRQQALGLVRAVVPAAVDVEGRRPVHSTVDAAHEVLADRAA